MAGAMLAAGLIAPGAASAATASVVNGTVVYTAAPGEVNSVTLSYEPPGEPNVGGERSDLFLAESSTRSGVAAPLQVGAGCHLVAGGAGCAVDPSLNAVLNLGDLNDYAADRRYPDSAGVEMYGGAGEDSLNVFESGYGNAMLDGGKGNDRLQANRTNAVLRGGDGDDTIGTIEGRVLQIDAGAGNDTVKVDTIQEYFPGSAASVKLGAGDDRLSFSFDAYSTVRETPYGPYNSPLIPESAIDGGPGKDLVKIPFSGGATFDLSLAPTNLEILDAENGATATDASGRSLGDLLIGSDGYEAFRAGPGPDVIIPGPKTDWVRSGAGADRIIANDGSVDHITCGVGTDRIRADAKDDLFARDCERPF